MDSEKVVVMLHEYMEENYPSVPYSYPYYIFFERAMCRSAILEIARQIQTHPHMLPVDIVEKFMDDSLLAQSNYSDNENASKYNQLYKCYFKTAIEVLDLLS